MIESKKEYREYLDADRVALLGDAKLDWKFFLKQSLAPNYIFRYQRMLRKLEYFKNCKSGFLNRLFYYYLKNKFRRESVRLGFSIPENVFGPGLSIVHYGTIIVNPNARIGKNCRIHADVNIGASGGDFRAPQIGSNVYIGPGAKIYGDIKIANNVAIGANSVVNKSFVEGDVMIAGIPAKAIKKIDISKIIKQSAPTS